MNAPTLAEFEEAKSSMDNAFKAIKDYRRAYADDPPEADDGDEGCIVDLRNAAEAANELLEGRENYGGEGIDDDAAKQLRARADEAIRFADGERPGNPAADQAKAAPKETQAQQILEIGREADLFRTQAGDLLATFPVRWHRETWPIASREFKGWLAATFDERHGKPPQPAAIAAALPILEQSARVGTRIESPHR